MIMLLLVSVPPDTDAPPLRTPALVVVPAVLVSRPVTVPSLLLMNVAALFTAAISEKLLTIPLPVIPTVPAIVPSLVSVPVPETATVDARNDWLTSVPAVTLVFVRRLLFPDIVRVLVPAWFKVVPVIPLPAPVRVMLMV